MTLKGLAHITSDEKTWGKKMHRKQMVFFTDFSIQKNRHWVFYLHRCPKLLSKMTGWVHVMNEINEQTIENIRTIQTIIKKLISSGKAITITGLSGDQISDRTGISKGTVRKYTKLLHLMGIVDNDTRFRPASLYSLVNPPPTIDLSPKEQSIVDELMKDDVAFDGVSFTQIVKGVVDLVGNQLNNRMIRETLFLMERLGYVESKNVGPTKFYRLVEKG